MSKQMDKSVGLRLDDLCITMKGQKLVHVDAQVVGGDILTIMGPSGSGKSTLLSALIGTLAPSFAITGRVVLNGRDLNNVPTDHRRIGILFQDHLLFPHLSVGQNLAFGLRRKAARGAERRELIDQALAEVGLEGFADRDPATLSGGQKARVALMRVLLSAPDALLLDEPFSGLDADLRVHIRSLVFDRARARELPVVMVTHDAEDADAAGSNLIKL